MCMGVGVGVDVYHEPSVKIQQPHSTGSGVLEPRMGTKSEGTLVGFLGWIRSPSRR